MTKRPFDLSLYLVAGSDAVKGRELIAVVEAAVQNGVTLVQLREKQGSPEAFTALARELKRRLVPYRVPLIINDSLDVALAADADGLHLGQDDMALAPARAALGPDKILGVSTGNRSEADAVDLSLADYVGVGPAYATGTKCDAGAAIGLTGLTDMRDYVALPMVAIGGIGVDQASAVMACGVDGVAVVSAICGAEVPGEAARRLRQEIDRGRAQVKHPSGRE